MSKTELGNIYSFISRGKSPQYVDRSNICVINQACIRWEGVDFENIKYQNPQKFNEAAILYEDDILIASTGTGTLGRCCIFRKPDNRIYLADSHVTILRAGQRTLPEIIRYYLMLPQTQLALYSQCVNGSTNQIELSKEKLKKFSIPDMELAEQERCISLLESLEQIISKRKEGLRKLDELVKARFVEMFGDPKLNTNHYPVSQLSEHINFLTSGSRGWAQYCTDDGPEWFITIKNVKDCHISLDNMQPVSAPDNAEAKRTKVQEGDLLISITADLGRTGVVTKDIAEHGAYINQHLTCIRLNKAVLNPTYVAYFMESPAGKDQFESKNQNAVKAGLNFNSINSLRLMIPPMEKQNEFVKFAEQTDKSKATIQKALDKTQLLFDSLMQKYFG